MTLEEIRALVRGDLRSVDEVIRERLKSAVPLVDRVAEHIVSGGGKRLRPLLVVLAGRACGHEGRSHIEAAAFIEFIHTATLLHDDVVDGSSLRRGRHTANEVFGNPASVLVGDFVYSRAFQMMASLSCQPVMEIMADATNVIAEGEVLQLMNAHDPDTTEQRYLEVIYRKTAKLFEAGAQVAAVLSLAQPPVQRALAAYGRHLGTAYQLVDDVLDYCSNPEQRGKNLGDDLAEGKRSMPMLAGLSCFVAGALTPVLSAEAPAPAEIIVLKAAHVFDATGTTLKDGATVVVRGDRIVSVGTGAAPPGARVIDLGDATLLPGFID